MEDPAPRLLSDKVPQLRTDLSIVLKPNAPGLYEVGLRGESKTFTMYDFEVSIARMLNGRRSVSQLIDAAAKIGIPVSLDSFQKFARQLHAYGFLVEPETPAQFAVDEATWTPRAEWKPEVRELFQSALRTFRKDRLVEARGYIEALLQIQPEVSEAIELLARVEERISAGDAAPKLPAFDELHGMSDAPIASDALSDATSASDAWSTPESPVASDAIDEAAGAQAMPAADDFAAASTAMPDDELSSARGVELDAAPTSAPHDSSPGAHVRPPSTGRVASLLDSEDGDSSETRQAAAPGRSGGSLLGAEHGNRVADASTGRVASLLGTDEPEQRVEPAASVWGAAAASEATETFSAPLGASLPSAASFTGTDSPTGHLVPSPPHGVDELPAGLALTPGVPVEPSVTFTHADDPGPLMTGELQAIRRSRWPLAVGAGVLLVAIIGVLAVPVKVTVSGTAELAPVAEAVELKAPRPGTIAKLVAQPGEWLEPGAVVALYDDTDARAQQAAVQSELDAVSRQLDREQKRASSPAAKRAAAALQKKQAELQRLSASRAKLAAGPKNAKTKKALAALDKKLKKKQVEVDKAQRAAAKSSPDTAIAALEAKADAAKAKLAKLQEASGAASVTATSAGIFAAAAHAGDAVKEGDVLGRVEDTRTLRARIAVPASSAKGLTAGNPVALRFGEHGEHGEHSVSATISKVADGTGPWAAEALIENPKRLLPAHASGVAEIDAGRRPLISRVFGVR